MIELKNVSKKFISGSSAVNALQSIDLKIKNGEFIALIGPSGSGKTTLLNIIGGLSSPSEGNVTVNDKDLDDLNDKELSKYRNSEIGFIFQEFHLKSDLSVKDNILLPTYFNGNTENKSDYANKLLKEVNLTNKENSKISELSGGQKQRTAIARALINKPKIILADEPTGNLDLKTGQTIIELLKELHKTHNVTLIIATHDNEIAKIAKRKIHIDHGELI